MNNQKPHVYKLKYKLEFTAGKFTGEDFDADESLGGCDAAILISIILPEDGSYSQTFSSKNGNTDNPISDNDLFKAWMMMGATIARKHSLSLNKRRLAAMPFEIAMGKLPLGAPDDEGNDII